MVYVRLDDSWTDQAGNTHLAGDMVDVDAGTLAQLEATGVVAAPDETAGWVGSGDDSDWSEPAGLDDWAAPTGTDDWATPADTNDWATPTDGLC